MVKRNYNKLTKCSKCGGPCANTSVWGLKICGKCAGKKMKEKYSSQSVAKAFKMKKYNKKELQNKNKGKEIKQSFPKKKIIKKDGTSGCVEDS